MRPRFDMQLEELNNEMIKMGMLCENAIDKASKCLISFSLSGMDDIRELLSQIDKQEHEVENICLKLFLHEQPVAKDLRTVSSAIKMVTDMERIGDQSSDLTEIISIGNIKEIPPELPILNMSTAVKKMVSESIDAFVKKDIVMAQAVIDYDDIVDGYFNRCKAVLISELKNNSLNGETLVDLLMIAKYFERIGDHAVNIASWVIFSITGELQKK